MTYLLKDLINIDAIQQLCEKFTQITKTVTAILDLDGNILVSTGWHDICTQFHRLNPDTASRCKESDTILARQLSLGENYTVYKCKNGLVDVAVPIIIDSLHVGNFFTGQFFFEPPEKEYFRRQAIQFGFDQDSYLEALSHVPVFTEEQVQLTMDFLCQLAQMVGTMGLNNLQLLNANENLKKEITERKETEKALIKSEVKYRNLVENIPLKVFHKDLNCVYVSCNEKYAMDLKIEPGEIAGTTDYDHYPKELAEKYIKDDQRIIESGKGEDFVEKYLADGQEFWVHTFKTPLTDNIGQTIGVLGVFRDVTELKQMEEEQEKLEAQLRQAQKMEAIGRLAGGVAHDYNNISSSIIGYSELVLEKLEQTDPMYQDLMEILNAANRSRDITRQLLTFARKQIIAPKVLDLNNSIESLITMLRRLIGEDIDLAWFPEAEVWPVKIDPSQIDQILANLCVNARDAITNVGKVTIETKNVSFDENYCADHAGLVPGEYTLLAVSDDGRGIAPENLDKIFEPFFTTKGLGKGTGLGLSTVYGIVKQNKGFINVYSEKGKGTTFRIYLPRHFGEVVETNREHILESPLSRGETVLLVEDDSSILDLSKRILEDLGYVVLSTTNPIEATRLATEHAGKITLLITDVVMPIMNGRELSEQLQILCPNLKTLFMSGYTANVIAHRGVLEDGFSFIAKPFSKNDLAVKVRELLDETKG